MAANRWGRGGMVGVGKARHEHERTEQRAAEILREEHGVRHQPGERADLCPLCSQLAGVSGAFTCCDRPDDDRT